MTYCQLLAESNIPVCSDFFLLYVIFAFALTQTIDLLLITGSCLSPALPWLGGIQISFSVMSHRDGTISFPVLTPPCIRTECVYVYMGYILPLAEPTFLCRWSTPTFQVDRIWERVLNGVQNKGQWTGIQGIHHLFPLQIQVNYLIPFKPLALFNQVVGIASVYLRQSFH